MNITLVGHSMGAIIVNNLLSVDATLKYNNIVHMASADSIANLFEYVLPYLSEHQGARFYSLSLHPENEVRESNALGTIPSGRLLV